jgi:hypothetical protein
MVTLLTILNEQKDLSCGTEENALLNEMNLRAIRPINTTLILEHLNMSADKDWVAWKFDSLHMRRWRITPAGKGALDDLKTGG